MSVVVAGESLVDLLVDEAGEVTARLGGGPFNVARGLARLEVACALLGAISTDRFGGLLRRALADDGVDERFVAATDAPTTLALAELRAGSAAYRFYTDGTAAPSLTAADTAAVVRAQPEALHVGTLGLVLEPMASALERLVAEVADTTLVMVDPNVRPGVLEDDAPYRARLARVLARADVVKASTEDLEALAPGAAALDTARELLGSRTRCVLVTAAADGVHVLTAGGEATVAALPVEVADTVGAGDAFCAGFLGRWRRERRGVDALADLAAAEDAARFAALVAGLTCERVGADPPRLAEVAARAPAFLDDRDP